MAKANLRLVAPTTKIEQLSRGGEKTPIGGPGST
jgi:hypothetical protein